MFRHVQGPEFSVHLVDKEALRSNDLGGFASDIWAAACTVSFLSGKEEENRIDNSLLDVPPNPLATSFRKYLHRNTRPFSSA